MALRNKMYSSNSTSNIQSQLSQNSQKIEIKPPGEIWPKDMNIACKLGDGSSSLVFLGSYHHKKVVIKEYNQVREDKRIPKEIMLKEWEILRASFPSKYVVKPVGYCQNPPRILMEYVKKGDLGHYILKNTLTTKQKISIAREVALGLLRLLEIGVVHRDIKPGNILITHDLHAKICDFDLARKINSSDPIKSSGTREYIAPEYYLKNFSDISLPAADVFSFGVVLLELFIHERDFNQYVHVCIEQKISVKERLLNIEAIINAFVEDYFDHWSDNLRNIIVDCLKMDAKSRPSMQNIQERLSQLLKAEAVIQENKKPISTNLISIFSQIHNDLLNDNTEQTEAKKIESSQSPVVRIEVEPIAPSKKPVLCCSVM